MIKPRIFLCDDDKDIVEVTRLVLGQYYTVDVFFKCDHIVSAAEELQPGVILLDLWMPDTGGEKVARELKANPGTKDIPVLLFSAANNISKVASDTMVNGFIAKPYNIDVLLETLAHVTGIETGHDCQK